MVGGRKVVFLHIGLESVLCQMENKEQNMEYIRNPLGGLETEERDCKVTRFTTLVTAGYCFLFPLLALRTTLSLITPGMHIY